MRAVREGTHLRMALIGNAAMLLWYDIVPDQVAEHDEWHTREHFAERVGIPGFLRAQRWVAHEATAPRYFVSYEVRDVATLTSLPYLERLEHPTPWTQRIMPHFRGMVRGFCRREHSLGHVLGAELLVVRFAARAGDEAALSRWLVDEALPAVVARAGIASAFTLAAEGAPPMTAEQALRGRDATVDRVLLVSGYDAGVVDAVGREALGASALEENGAVPGSVIGRYRLACRGDA